LLVDNKFVADALCKLATDASGLAGHALGADSQSLNELLRIAASILERGGHTTVHNSSRDSRDGKSEWEYNVCEMHRVGSWFVIEGE
jgi:hypothetical protein